MPMHFKDVDVIPEIAGLESALLVPCIMCPAVTVAIRERQPLMRLFRHLFKSPPFERYLKDLQTRLRERGVAADVFRSRLYPHWFLCMWSARQRRKLRKRARDYQAVIVLGCNSATETVCNSLDSPDCRVIEGMEVAGLTNARLKFRWPAHVSFEDVRIVPLPRRTSQPGQED
jgi:hypothetical protein